MARDLTTSQVDRQNILNNENAVAEIQNQTGLQGIMFEGRLRFTKAMVASFFEVEVRTIERYVSENIEEISANGYEVIKGKRLKDFLNCVLDQDVPDINVGNISNRTPQIALFDFKAFLNISMLLVESENAKVLRQIMLDIVIDFVNQRTGGSTKYINQRDRDFISAFLQEKLTMGDCWLPPLALRVQTTNQSNQHYQIVVRQFPHSIKSLLDELRVVFLCIKKLKWGDLHIFADVEKLLHRRQCTARRNGLNIVFVLAQIHAHLVFRHTLFQTQFCNPIANKLLIHTNHLSATFRIAESEC